MFKKMYKETETKLKGSTRGTRNYDLSIDRGKMPNVGRNQEK